MILHTPIIQSGPYVMHNKACQRLTNPLLLPMVHRLKWSIHHSIHWDNMNKFMKTIIGLYVRLIYVKRALKQIRRPHLGDIVFYQGKTCQLLQGACSPYWDLWHEEERTRINSVHEGQFQMQPLYHRFWFSFRFTYRFYMRSWHTIDVMYKRQSFLNKCASTFVFKR